MNQFVPYFLEEEPSPYPRATSIQKCIRLSGKHNDIDELGKTRRHMSFFEMLGNFSFGDYFKEGAIKLAWELLTEKVGFDGDRLWITVHTSDDEAEAIWHEQIGVPMERIQRLGDKENFWDMGPTGPCGPCSEIHFDCGPEWGDEGGPEHGGGDRYVEFWNLVFMQNQYGEGGAITRSAAQEHRHRRRPRALADAAARRRHRVRHRRAASHHRRGRAPDRRHLRQRSGDHGRAARARRSRPHDGGADRRRRRALE